MPQLYIFADIMCRSIKGEDVKSKIFLLMFRILNII